METFRKLKPVCTETNSDAVAGSKAAKAVYLLATYKGKIGPEIEGLLQLMQEQFLRRLTQGRGISLRIK